MFLPKGLPTITRTLRIAAIAALVTFAVLLQAGMPAGSTGNYIFYVGTYTESSADGGTGSKGIYGYRYDASTSQITPLGLAAETINPSWIALHPNGRFLYAVNEIGNYKFGSEYNDRSSGSLSSFSIDRDKDGHPTGKLTFLNSVPTQGADPCYVTVDRAGRYAVAANYTGGSVIVFRIRGDGSLGGASTSMEYTGHGPNLQRQRSAHVHAVNLSPDNRFVYVDDLGSDSLYVFKFDSNKGTLAGNVAPPIKFEPGAGPRHFASHPSGKFAYVISEMASTVTTLSIDPDTGVFHSLQTISTLPKDFSGEKEAAEIEVHPSGKFLYASNRGAANSIAVFAIDPGKGTLTPVEYVPSQGKTPRSFEVDPTGRLLFVANQNSNNIAIFRIDQNTGRLKPTGKVIETPSPVSLKFLKVE